MANASGEKDTLQIYVSKSGSNTADTDTDELAS